jgi:TolA-binding protein
MVLLIFVLGIFTFQIRNLGAKVERLLIRDSSKDIQILNNQKQISKNQFRIEQIEQMKVPATGNRFTKKDAQIMELNIKEWTKENFVRKE